MACGLLLVITGSLAARSSDPEDGARVGEVVVLLHGLARSSFSMNELASMLEEAGYATHNIDYPSTRLEAQELGGMLHDRLNACCSDAERVHFVTHSMGGIVVRAYLAQHDLPNLGRVVMLAPPNRGSEWVDSLRELAVFEWIMGPTAVELGTNADSLPNRLPPATYPLGVIAGNEVVNPMGAAVIPGDDDGTVAVESTRLEGMSDFIEMPVSHTFIMHSDEVARQVLRFLQMGHFDHGAEAPGEVVTGDPKPNQG